MSSEATCKLRSLQAELASKEAELEALREVVRKIPEIARFDGDVCIPISTKNAKEDDQLQGKVKGPMGPGKGKLRKSSVLIQSYRAETVSHIRRQVEDYCRDLVINNDHIHTMEMRLRQAIEKGLASESHHASSVKCFPTYVRELPSGYERGKFLALDLGGTNFRVVIVDIDHDKFEMDSKVYAINQEVMRGTQEQLFDHIAECLASFTKAKGVDKEVLPLGFTFSFPCKQKGLAVGELITWTKGFTCSGVEGQDVVALLKEAIGRRGDIRVDVAAILNDTTGCLMSCAWKNPKCRIGLIIGTGTNACYLEDLDQIDLWDGDARTGPKHMIINTEWGAFGDHGELDFILTKWDRRVDAGSLNPGKQIFEKMISGMYMGEVVRQVLVDLVNEELIFAGQTVDLLFEDGRFYTRYVSEIESDPVGEFDKCREVLAELDMVNVAEEDCSALRFVCECVSRRAGFMVSAGVTALLKKMDYKDVVVAIDGSVFRYHPHFPNIMRSRISQLMGTDYKFDLMLSSDGSGRGAALVAAVLLGECAIK